jgi:DNA-binding transcriptional regulator YbjK
MRELAPNQHRQILIAIADCMSETLADRAPNGEAHRNPLIMQTSHREFVCSNGIYGTIARKVAVTASVP